MRPYKSIKACFIKGLKANWGVMELLYLVLRDKSKWWCVPMKPVQ